MDSDEFQRISDSPEPGTSSLAALCLVDEWTPENHGMRARDERARAVAVLSLASRAGHDLARLPFELLSEVFAFVFPLGRDYSRPLPVRTVWLSAVQERLSDFSVTRDGDFLVVGRQVYLCDPSGRLVHSFAVCAAGAALVSGAFIVTTPGDYVNGGAAKEHGVSRYDCRGGLCLGTCGTKGSAPGCFCDPRGVVVDRRGNVLVADTMNNRVQVLNAELEPLRVIGRKGRGSGEFLMPTRVAVSDTGEILVGETGNQRVQLLRADGTHVRTFQEFVTDTGERVRLKRPVGVAFDRAGNVVIADSALSDFGGAPPGSHRVLVVDRDGKLLFQWVVASGCCVGVTVLTSGQLAVAVFNNDRNNLIAFV